MARDIVGAGERWIPEQEYRVITDSVPIVCVDVLLMDKHDPSRVGLIRRETYDGGFGWCLVGGAVLKDESLDDAVARHVLATLGDQIIVDRESLQMRTVAEYFTNARPGRLHDPRKHAVAITFLALSDGEAQPLGEALAFEWFQVKRLADVSFGFGQGAVVARVLGA